MAQPPADFGLPSNLYVIPGHPAPNTSSDADFVIYGYVPSLALSILGVVWYGGAAVAALALLVFQGSRLWRILRWDTLLGLTLIGLVCEVVGYIFRILSKTNDPYNITDFVVQYFLIVVAPIFFSAAVYLALGRVIRGAALQGVPQISPLSPKAILWIFVSCDIATIAAQVAGAGWLGAEEGNQAPDSAPPNIGPPQDVLIAGLAVQTASFALWFAVYFLCCGRLSKLRSSAQTDHLSSFLHTCSVLLGVLGAVGALIELRTVFRLIEACVGFFGYLEQHEAYFGTLEFTPIALAVVGLLVVGSMTRQIMQRGKPEFLTSPGAPPA